MAQLNAAVPQRSALCMPYARADLGGEIKQTPEDFRVIERLGFAPSGAGEHLFLLVRKTGLTTHQLIERLCSSVGLSPRQAGYSGLKDKQAVTDQWISLHLPGCKDIPQFEETPDFQILEAGWHERKLRIGTHRANYFEVRVSNLHGIGSGLQQCVQNIKQAGFANYFGEQRFGASQDNVEQALKNLANTRRRKRLSRTRRGLYLSALRGHLFNRILSSRIDRGVWREPLNGDLFMLDGSRSIFSDSLSEETVRRYTEFDIHSAVSLYGEGESRLLGAAAALEEEIVVVHREMTDVLIGERLKRDYRPNRALVRSLEVEIDRDRAELCVRVELGRGVYLTSLLNQLLEITVPEPV